MRVLHVFKSYFPDTQGGLEETIRQICLNTAPYGVSSSVFAITPSSGPRTLSREEAQVHRSPRTLQISACDLSVRAFWDFKKLLSHVDLVHYHFPWPMGDLLHIFCRPDIPSLVTYHSDVVRPEIQLALYRPIKKMFLNNVDSIVATSPNYFATSDVLTKYSNKVEIIPIGLNESTYPQPSSDEVEAKRQQFGQDFFLFVGVMRYYKGLHILIEALRGTKDLPVLIVGAGPVEAEVKRHAESLGLDNVYFLGPVTDTEKMALFQLARGVVFPSHLRSEAFGLTLLEGAMQGRPLISTEIGTGTSYVNKDGESGIVVPPGDPRRLREAMERLASNPELAERLGRGARQRYEAHFTGELMGKHYAELYKRLLGGDGGRKETAEEE